MTSVNKNDEIASVESLSVRAATGDWRQHKVFAEVRQLGTRIKKLEEAKRSLSAQLADVEQKRKDVAIHRVAGTATANEVQTVLEALESLRTQLSAVDDDIVEAQHRLDVLEGNEPLSVEYEAKLHAQIVLHETYIDAVKQMDRALQRAYEANQEVCHIHDLAADQFGVNLTGNPEVIRVPSAAGLPYLEWQELYDAGINDSHYVAWCKEIAKALPELEANLAKLRKIAAHQVPAN